MIVQLMPMRTIPLFGNKSSTTTTNNAEKKILFLGTKVNGYQRFEKKTLL